MNDPSPLRFFAVVLKPSASLLVVLVSIVAFSVWLARNDSRDVDQTVVLVLVFQMFSAAHGYHERAVRGHFDPILGQGRSRGTVAAAHWFLSVIPGAVAWLLVTAVLCVVHRTARPASLTVSALVAFTYVSSAAWAFALPFTRYTSGVIWILALVLLAGFGRIDTLREAFVASGHSWTIAFMRAIAAGVCPVFLLANSDTTDWTSLAFVVLFATFLLAACASFIPALDLPLKDPSW